MNSPADKPINYLTVSDLYNINHTLTNGDTFVRELRLLQSAAARPAITVFGEAQFPTLLDKAAALIHSLAYHHVFADGNKRTAVEAVVLFLERNGYEITWKYDIEYPFILEVAQGKHDVEAIAAWLAQYVRPLEP